MLEVFVAQNFPCSKVEVIEEEVYLVFHNDLGDSIESVFVLGIDTDIF